MIFMGNGTLSAFNFTIRDFEVGGAAFRVAITAELFADDGGLDFTGAYTGILISEQTGTLSFGLFPDEEAEFKWEASPENLNPLLIKELAKIIHEIREGKSITTTPSFN